MLAPATDTPYLVVYGTARATEGGAPELLQRLAYTIEHLVVSLAGRGRVLEIGVGTGVLALPLAARGLDVAGVAVSTAMLAKLRQKASSGEHVRVLEADARRLPFREGAFGGAYLRHVFHLIPGWRNGPLPVEMARKPVAS